MKKGRRLSGLLCAACCVACVTISLTASVAQTRSASQGSFTSRFAGRTITGTVIGVGGRFGGRSYPFKLVVNQITSPEDVQRLNSALQSGGQDELQRTLSQMNAGRIVVGNNVGVQANAIIETPGTEGGTRLTVLYERNINFYELRSGSRSEDYKFGYAELFLGNRAGNQGTFIPAARVRLRDGNTWEVEDFGVFPARLMGLQVHSSNGQRRIG